MTVTLKYKIIELLAKDLTNFYSISDISKQLGVAYSHTHSFVKLLTDENVIIIKKIGNVSVCNLNLKSPMARAYLATIEARKAKEWIKKNPHSNKIIEKIESVKDNVHAVLLKNNNVIILVPEKITGVDFTLFRNRTVVTARQIRKHKKQYENCIILHGAEKFWSLITN